MGLSHLQLDLSPPKVYNFNVPAWNKKGAEALSVYRNPSKAQVSKALKEAKYLRVLRNTKNNDIYAWPGDEGLHADIMRDLGLTDDSVENLGYLQSYEDLQEVIKYIADGSGEPRYFTY